MEFVAGATAELLSIRTQMTEPKSEDEGAALLAASVAMRAELLKDAKPSPPISDTVPQPLMAARVRPLIRDEASKLGLAIPGNTTSSFAQFDYEAIVADEGAAKMHALSENRGLGNEAAGGIAVRTFTPHQVYGPSTSTTQLFERGIAPLLAKCADGQATVIAYGQTGTGKTHTMRELQQMCIQRLLEQEGGELLLSFFELIGDRCSDLLHDGASLTLRDDGSGGIVVDGLQDVAAKTVEEALDLLKAGNEARATRVTKGNDQSSRSHAVCTLRRPSGGGKLRLVDLAGSERARDAAEHGAEAVQEMRSINSDLGNLKECLRLRREMGERKPGAKAPFVPYRRSKLTMLLRASLVDPLEEGADAAVAFLAHVSPLRSHGQHSVNTLDYVEQMVVATRDVRERATFNEIEKWSSKKVVEWVRELEGGKYAHLAEAFSRCPGKQLANEFIVDVTKWVEAFGGTEADANAIYDAFKEMWRDAKKAAAKASGGGRGKGKGGGPPKPWERGGKGRGAPKKDFVLVEWDDTLGLKPPEERAAAAAAAAAPEAKAAE